MKYNNKLKNKRKRKINIKRLLLTTTFLCIIAIMPIALSSFFKIKRIEVIGNKNISTNDIKKTVDHYINKNILMVKSNKIKQSIITNLPIEDVKINYKLPNTLIVKVKEREGAAILHYLNGFALMDVHGVIIKLESKIEGYPVPIITGFNVTEAQIAKKPVCDLDKDSFDKLLALISAIKPVSQNLSEINVSKDKSRKPIFSLYTIDGYKIVLDSFEDEDKLRTSFKILQDLRENSRGKGIIDVSSDTPVFRKFKDR